MSNSVHISGSANRGDFEFSIGDEMRGERATLGKTLLDIQRDLRIKAAYLAAIEDARPDVFPNQSFVPGYVRSYARYLGLDPDEVFARFCAESGFIGKPGAKVSLRVGDAETRGGHVKLAASARGRLDFPLARAERRGLPDIPTGALGSVLVMLVLLAGLGYGGWMVLQSIQRVQFAPVEEMPLAVSEVDILEPPGQSPLDAPDFSELASPVAATALADLYRRQELEVPILVPRDGPIAGLDPDSAGGLVRYLPSLEAPEVIAAEAAMSEIPAALMGPQVEPQTPAAAESQSVVVVAERAAWIRVYQANGTVLFEKILEKGESYTPPRGVDQPMIWAGNSGSVYVRIGDELRGPLGRGTRAARDISLDPAVLVERYGVVAEVPEVISQSSGLTAPATQPAIAIR